MKQAKELLDIATDPQTAPTASLRDELSKAKENLENARERLNTAYDHIIIEDPVSDNFQEYSDRLDEQLDRTTTPLLKLVKTISQLETELYQSGMSRFSMAPGQGFMTSGSQWGGNSGQSTPTRTQSHPPGNYGLYQPMQAFFQGNPGNLMGARRPWKTARWPFRAVWRRWWQWWQPSRRQ